MNSSLDRFQAVWNWHRVAYRALDVFERDVRTHPEDHLDALRAESQQTALLNTGMCRDELEDFALLSLWAVFEDAINAWLIQHVRWIDVQDAFDQKMRSQLTKRLERWSVEEKIDVLKPLVGVEAAQNLQAIRRWRDWVAHRKTTARPEAVDFESAQSIFVAVLTRLEMTPDGVKNGQGASGMRGEMAG